VPLLVALIIFPFAEVISKEVAIKVVEEEFEEKFIELFIYIFPRALINKVFELSELLTFIEDVIEIVPAPEQVEHDVEIITSPVASLDTISDAATAHVVVVEVPVGIKVLTALADVGDQLPFVVAVDIVTLANPVA
jgi:hypothetical protein